MLSCKSDIQPITSELFVRLRFANPTYIFIGGSLSSAPRTALRHRYAGEPRPACLPGMPLGSANKLQTIDQFPNKLSIFE